MKQELIGLKLIEQLKHFVYARVNNDDEAEEILQETLISAYESLASFHGRSSFFVWLAGIAKHEIADYYRKKKIKTLLFSHLPFLEELADEALGPQEKMVEDEFKRKVRRVFSRMSEGYQVVLRLKYIDGQTVAEIAQKLNLTAKAVESRLTRARLAFRAAWAVENSKFKVQNEKSIFRKDDEDFG